MGAVLDHELTMYSNSMKAYVFCAFMLLFTGVGALVYNINASVANFEYVLQFISIVFIVLVPLMTMRTMAEEKNQNTDKLLYSMPLSSTEIVMGKYLALLVVFAIPVIIICMYPLLFSRFGDVYLPTSYGSILAFFFLGAALLSIGMFISCLCDSQNSAAGLCVAVMILLYYADTLANYVSTTAAGSLVCLLILAVLVGVLVRTMTRSRFTGLIVFAVLAIALVVTYLIKSDLFTGLLPDIMNQISLYTRFKTFVNGVFDLRALIYDVSVIAFFLFLCVQALEKRRYNG